MLFIVKTVRIKIHSHELLVSGVTMEAYERRIKKLEREKSELSWKLQESTKVLQEQSIDSKTGSRSSESGNFNEELAVLKRKNNGKIYKMMKVRDILR